MQDKITITWIPDDDSYVLNIPEREPILLWVGQLTAIKEEIERIMKELAE